MGEASSYEPQRFAEVTDTPDWEVLSFVVLGRWDHRGGGVEWCLDYLDDRMGEVRDDDCFGTEAGARESARSDFGIGENDWRDGWPGVSGGDWSNG